MQVDLHQLMRQALCEAEKGFAEGEVPVGAVVSTPDGEAVAMAHNQPIALCDSTAHAEILAIREAGLSYKNYRLNGALLVVTLEPCIMCMGAALHARMARVVFGATDQKAGACGSLYDLGMDTRFNHGIEIVSGIMEEECRDLLRRFFQGRRENQANLRGEVPKWS